MQEQHSALTIIAPPPQGELGLTGQPTFSVVIPAYQAAATIPEAVASALRQTSPPHEVIVVDDGSTDDLSAALAPFASDIKLISKENGGVASARNVGIRAATGEFVAFLDADDRFHPKRLEVLRALAAARPDLDILATDTAITVEGVAQSLFSDATPFATRDQRTAIFDSCFFTGPVVRRERLRAIGGYDESLEVANDWDCYIRLILDGAIAGCVSEPYYEYRQSAESLTANRLRALQGRVKVLRKAMRRSDLTRNERVALRRALSRHHTRAALLELEAELDGLDAKDANRVPHGRRLRRLTSRSLSNRGRILLLVGMIAPGVARKRLPRDRGTLLERFTS
jgi:glycosyltransferase involved in cell wall biosynthesis